MWNYKEDFLTKESVYVYDSVTRLIVGTLTCYTHDCADSVYVFVPDWNCPLFDNNVLIPGYDIEAHLTEYVREGEPCFMTEFLPPAGREDSYELMLSVGIDMPYDMWAFVVEQGRVCMDNWRVARIPGDTYEHDKYKITKKI